MKTILGRTSVKARATTEKAKVRQALVGERVVVHPGMATEECCDCTAKTHQTTHPSYISFCAVFF